jgi:hypothetical protein
MRCHINKRKAKTTRFNSLTLIERKSDSITPPPSCKKCRIVASPKDRTIRLKLNSFRAPRRKLRLAAFTTKDPHKRAPVGWLV